MVERKLVQGFGRLATLCYTASYECGAVACVDVYHKLHMLLVGQGITCDDTFVTIRIHGVFIHALDRKLRLYNDFKSNRSGF